MDYIFQGCGGHTSLLLNRLNDWYQCTYVMFYVWVRSVASTKLKGDPITLRLQTAYTRRRSLHRGLYTRNEDLETGRHQFLIRGPDVETDPDVETLLYLPHTRLKDPETQLQLFNTGHKDPAALLQISRLLSVLGYYEEAFEATQKGIDLCRRNLAINPQPQLSSTEYTLNLCTCDNLQIKGVGHPKNQRRRYKFFEERTKSWLEKLGLEPQRFEAAIRRFKPAGFKRKKALDEKSADPFATMKYHEIARWQDHGTCSRG
ncbi:hypothetical protein RSAG8_09772, partial [Rhizoctonia solani AG-8 WAC10335]